VGDRALLKLSSKKSNPLKSSEAERINSGCHSRATRTR
jgi:hypothetical protein